MLEFAVVAILVLAVVGGTALSAAEKEAASRTWPVQRPDVSKSEPAEEGAAVPEGEPVSGTDLREAA